MKEMISFGNLGYTHIRTLLLCDMIQKYFDHDFLWRILSFVNFENVNTSIIAFTHIPIETGDGRDRQQDSSTLSTIERLEFFIRNETADQVYEISHEHKFHFDFIFFLHKNVARRRHLVKEKKSCEKFTFIAWSSSVSFNFLSLLSNLLKMPINSIHFFRDGFKLKTHKKICYNLEWNF